MYTFQVGDLVEVCNCWNSYGPNEWNGLICRVTELTDTYVTASMVHPERAPDGCDFVSGGKEYFKLVEGYDDGT